MLRITDGVIFGGTLGDGGNDSALREGKFAARFAEIPLRSRFHSQSVLAQIDDIHITKEDFILVVPLGDFQGKILFLKLALDHFDHIAVFFRPCGEDGVFQQLLSDGAGTFFGLAHGLHKTPGRSSNSIIINTVMLIKALILNSHKSLSQMFWDKVHVVNLYTVGIHTHILIYFIAFTVIDNGCLSGGGNCFQGDSGSGSENTFENADTCGYSADD